MRVFLAVVVAVAAASVTSACSSHGAGLYKAPPGQVQKVTGYNPASGKFKGAPANLQAPGKGNAK